MADDGGINCSKHVKGCAGEDVELRDGLSLCRACCLHFFPPQEAWEGGAKAMLKAKEDHPGIKLLKDK